jgi:ankyrin repeat protein
MKRILFLILCICLAFFACTISDTPNKNDKLLKAAVDGKFTVVQKLLTNGADVNAKDKDSETVLMKASFINLSV